MIKTVRGVALVSTLGLSFLIAGACAAPENGVVGGDDGGGAATGAGAQTVSGSGGATGNGGGGAVGTGGRGGSDAGTDRGGMTTTDAGTDRSGTVGTDAGTDRDGMTTGDAAIDRGAGAGGGGGGGGAGGAGGTTGTGGAGGGNTARSACAFASGLNVAWVRFANDVPNPNVATFRTIFQNTYAAGGRVVRWWFHTNGTVTPGYQSNGMVQKIPQSHIDGVKSVLAAAHSAGVLLNISLWSFDMLQSNAGATHTQNQALLENDAVRMSYVTNYLTPLVTALRGTPGLYSYEIFNEPEGMGPRGWATYRTSEAAIQKCVNWFAAAIHAADPDVLVTNGAVTFDYCSNVAGKTNYYSDSALASVGGMPGGTLNFYEVHYYASNGTSNSAFLNPASHWGLTDKKLVMGELAAQDTDGVARDNLYAKLYDTGYNGAWAWSYDADWPWPAMQAGLQNVHNAHGTQIDACR